MKVTFVKPRQELQPYIKSICVFASAVGLPQADTSLVAPNGRPKLIVLCENSLESTVEGQGQVNREGIYFVGNRDVSAVLRTSPRRTKFIVVEFLPHGAFPLFGIPMQETVNRLFQTEIVFGRWGRDVWETVCNLEGVGQKVHFLQDQLVQLSRKKQRDNRLIDSCVRVLEVADGRVAIRELESTIGYTRRYLDLLFHQHVGFSPKVLAGIFRFQKFYRKWAEGQSFDLIKKDLYGYYYDQSHFTKEFRKKTGYSPQRFSREVFNEFGRRLALR